MRQLEQVFFSVLLVMVCCQAVSGYRILSIIGSPSRSHVIVQEALAKELARRGHQVTMVSPFPSEHPVDNYREITVPISDWGKSTMALFLKDQSRFASFINFPTMCKIFMDSSNDTINDPEVRRVILKEKFDLLIVGIMGDFILGVGQLIGAPTMVVCPNAAMGVVNDMFGNPYPISAVPNAMLGIASPMNFTNRIKNLFSYILELVFGWYIKSVSERYYNSNFPRDKFPAYDVARKNVSLVLINQHFTKASPRPYVQSMVEIGGLQIKPTPDPLPGDLQQWMDGAEDGIIFFSLGTNIQSSSMPSEKLNAVLNTFRELKQRIVWKWDSHDMPDKPPNVLLRKWLPQDDILAHKNVRLFITHGGLGGVAEAQYHGVPLVGIPIFGDQKGNLEKVKREGWAVIVEFAELTEDTLTRAVNEVLNNASYRETVKSLADLYRDRPMSPMDTAVFWTEYVIRHKGAKHMRYPGVDLNFWQRHLLDVIAVLGAGVFVVVKLISYTYQLCRRKVLSKIKLN
ncbi:UDP-glucosyltransferase 2-like [Topomyia yanbarensis]|uniref:UDP-glucosyltransferase 2-like n=1 Tax=Topomyia yanbarensis TaxID=2498891 RepID=UPI00273B26C8|nr:UDP-glucosyltransferase 2-like [Topomyia yanbarensis]